MKKLNVLFFLIFIVSISLIPYGSISAVKLDSNFTFHVNDSLALCREASVPDYYIQQVNGDFTCLRSLKAEKPRSFERNVSFPVFCNIQKKIDAVFYPPYLYACSIRCISLSKFKKLTIYNQTVL